MEQHLGTTLTATPLPAESLRLVAVSAMWVIPAPTSWGQQAKRLQMALKRLIDIVVAAAGLVLLGPPMLVVALAIKLDSSGPVLHVQERVGLSGRPFRMYKFRSMAVNAHVAKGGLANQNQADGPLFKIKHDPRRTSVGGWIRRFSIDELPQLFNVLRGDMSLVGPRPALPEEAGNPLSDYHAHRVLAVPGITGLWQVNGRSLLSFGEMVEMDIRYARDWSLWLDIWILARTIPVIVSGKGAW